jgi:hypothetical protein
VSQLISPITGALVVEEEDNGDEVDGCNEESSGGNPSYAKTYKHSYNDSDSYYNPFF